MARTIAKCVECGQEREIVSQGRCAKCNMRRRRAEEIAAMEDVWDKPAKHMAEKQKAQKKARAALNGIRNYLEDLESPPFLPEHLINMIRAAIKPALVLSIRSLDPDDGEPEAQIDTDTEPPAGEPQIGREAEAARAALDEMERAQAGLRADVESALRNQGYSAALAKRKAQMAVGADFDSIFRDATKAAEDEVSVADSGKLTESGNLLTQKNQAIGEKVNLKLTPSLGPRYGTPEWWASQRATTTEPEQENVTVPPQDLPKEGDSQ
jgi:hypothetical protein